MIFAGMLRKKKGDRRRWSGIDASNPLLTWAARIGYAACGIIYLAIGLGAGAVAVGLAERPRGSHDLMLLMARQPFGDLALVALGTGLAAYAALNIAGAISDPEEHGVSVRALLLRAADALTGALYIGLAVAALGMVASPETNGVSTAVSWARNILALPFGRVILATVGLSLLGGGGYLLYRAWSEPFGSMLDRRSLSRSARRMIAIAARAGTVARAVILGICGFFVIRAAMSATPGRVADVGDALAVVGRAALGPLLLAAAGAGFVAYGGYQLAKARYQRIGGAAATGSSRSGRPFMQRPR